MPGSLKLKSKFFLKRKKKVIFVSRVWNKPEQGEWDGETIKVKSIHTRGEMERKKEEEENEEQAGHPPLWHDGVVEMGEGRRPDVKQSEGHQRESNRWSENQREVATHCS